jgi:hypothetical protein
LKDCPKASDFFCLLKFSKSLQKLKILFKDLLTISIFFKIHQIVDHGAINGIIEDINNLIDFRDSTKQNRVVVNEGVDNSLDRLKSLYLSLPDLLVCDFVVFDGCTRLILGHLEQRSRGSLL